MSQTRYYGMGGMRRGGCVHEALLEAVPNLGHRNPLRPPPYQPRSAGDTTTQTVTTVTDRARSKQGGRGSAGWRYGHFVFEGPANTRVGASFRQRLRKRRQLAYHTMYECGCAKSVARVPVSTRWGRRRRRLGKQRVCAFKNPRGATKTPLRNTSAARLHPMTPSPANHPGRIKLK